MSTEYYLRIPNSKCPTCSSHEYTEELSIGTSAFGWAFALALYPSRGITSLELWTEKFLTYEIQDEYGARIRPEEMLSIIAERSGFPDSPLLTPEFLARNCAQVGYKGLLFSTLGGYTPILDTTYQFYLGEGEYGS